MASVYGYTVAEFIAEWKRTHCAELPDEHRCEGWRLPRPHSPTWEDWLARYSHLDRLADRSDCEVEPDRCDDNEERCYVNTYEHHPTLPWHACTPPPPAWCFRHHAPIHPSSLPMLTTPCETPS